MRLNVNVQIGIKQMWDELSEVLGFNEFIDVSSPSTEKVVADMVEIGDHVKQLKTEEPKPAWWYQAETSPYPKGYKIPRGMSICKAIREERIGQPLERFECFYEAETNSIQEAVKEQLGVAGYMSYRDACNVGSWY